MIQDIFGADNSHLLSKYHTQDTLLHLEAELFLLINKNSVMPNGLHA